MPAGCPGTDPPGVQKLVGSHPGREIAMLLHGGVNRVIIAEALGLDLMDLFRIDQSFGRLISSITTMTAWP
jgi:broad specificity phosphatase PhoE